MVTKPISNFMITCLGRKHTMSKQLTLWQKLKIKYHYHWMDKEYTSILRHAALPTWYMTHSQEQIDIRQAKFEAKEKKARQEQLKSVHLLKRLSEEIQREQSLNGDNKSSTIS